MTLALDDAGLTPRDVDVVYASANGTRVLDAAEASALDPLFGGSPARHHLGERGAGRIGRLGRRILRGGAAVRTRRACVPPIAGLERPDPLAASLNLARTALAAPGPIVLVNSFASGGALFSVVLRVASAPAR